MGPGWKRSGFAAWSSVSIIMLPTMSAGMRSGVNWMREYLSCRGAREGSQQRGLAEAGNAFQQHMAAGEQTDQDAFDDVILADDNFGDFAADSIEPLDRKLECRFSSHV